MPPKKGTTTTADTADAGTSGGFNLSERELQILAAVMKCNKAEVLIDYAKLAETGGFKTTASARAGWHTIRKKMGIALNPAGGKGAEGADGTKTPVKAGNKRKKAAAEEGEDDEESVGIATPKPKSGKKAKAKVEVEEDGSETGTSTPAAKKATPAKKGKAGKKAKALEEVVEDEEVEEGEIVEEDEVDEEGEIKSQGSAPMDLQGSDSD